jgi:DNA-binding GntR family transcriptional regulator
VRACARTLADIPNGAWPIGAHLTLAQLEARYGVNQSPIREALLHLAGDGVPLLRAHRGGARRPARCRSRRAATAPPATWAP